MEYYRNVDLDDEQSFEHELLNEVRHKKWCSVRKESYDILKSFKLQFHKTKSIYVFVSALEYLIEI